MDENKSPLNTNIKILIPVNRIFILTSALMITGLFCVYLSYFFLIELKTINFKTIILTVCSLIFGGLLFLFSLKILSNNRLQLEINNEALKFRDVRKQAIGRNKTGVGMKFYSTRKFCIIKFKDIVKVAHEKHSFQCKLIYIVTKDYKKIYIPLLLDSCKAVNEIANIIDRKYQDEMHKQNTLTSD